MYKSPIHFAAALSAEFVLKALPHKAASVLDVGCGDGLIAAKLVEKKVDLLALDSNPKSVEKTRALGIETVACNILDFNHTPFDLIIVSRALHHMPDLPKTIKKLSSLLKTDGRLLIDDFGFEYIEAREAGWLIDQTKQIKAAFAEQPTRHAWLLNSDNLDPQKAYLLWRDIHWLKHGLVTAAAMKKELSNQLQVEFDRSGPYLFRYLCDLLPETEEGAEEAQRIRRLEQDLIAKDQLRAVGIKMSLRN